MSRLTGPGKIEPQDSDWFSPSLLTGPRFCTNFCIHFVLLISTQTMPSTGRGPPKNRTKHKCKQRESVVSCNDDMTMDYDNLEAMSVPPERPAGESSVLVPFPGGQGYHAYECWCDACLSTLVTRWKEFHPDETVVPKTRRKKPVVPFV